MVFYRPQLHLITLGHRTGPTSRIKLQKE